MSNTTGARDERGESGRMLDSLPAIYRNNDIGGHLERLLGVFEEVLFRSDKSQLPGIEQQIDAIPSFFSPSGIKPGYGIAEQSAATRAPDRFLPWLATWVAFTPHTLFPPEQLRIILRDRTPLQHKGHAGLSGTIIEAVLSGNP